MLRRSLLTAALPLALGACGLVTTSGNTVTLSLTRLEAWADAVKSNVDLILSLPAVSKAAGDKALLISSAAKMVADDATALRQKMGGTISLSFDRSSPPAALQSLLSDVQSIVDAIMALGLAPGLSEQIAPYLMAIRAVAADVKALTAA